MLKRVGIALAAIVAIVGCQEVEISNGEIPQEYLQYAEKFLGTYQGAFDGAMGNLEVSLDGQKLIVKFVGAHGDEDILDADCSSKIGDLTKLYISGTNASNYRVDGANLDFSAGQCASTVEGENMYVGIDYRNGHIYVQVEILERYEWQQVCSPTGGHRPPPGHGPGMHCTWESRPVYLVGRFKR